MRWALVLQQYQFTLRAIKGSENVGATRSNVMFQYYVTVCLFVFCIVKCFVVLNMYFAVAILQSIGMCITPRLCTVLYDSMCMIMHWSY